MKQYNAYARLSDLTILNQPPSTYKDDILAHTPWVKFIINETAQQRYREKRDLGKLVYLGSEYDVSTDDRLIRIEFEIA